MESTLSAPEYVGALDKGGTQVKAWKYTIDHASEIVVVSTFSVKDGQTGTVTDFSYDLANAQATTAVLQKGDTATVRIAVRNNAGVEANSTSPFVPLLSKATSVGDSFTPEGTAELPLSLASIETSSNYTVKCIKLNLGVTYNVNRAPQPGEYTEVANASDADLLLLASTKPLEVNKGGYVSVSYAVSDGVGPAFNDKRDVFNTVLGFDIEGNSILTLESNAVIFADTDIVLTKVWKDGGNASGLRPDAFAAPLTLSSDKGIDRYRSALVI